MLNLFLKPAQGHLLALGAIAIGALATFVLYAVSAFPVTGIIAMMLLGPLWVNISIHGTMAALVTFIVARRVPAVWLILPTSFYVAGLLDHQKATAMAIKQRDEVRARNAAISYPPLTSVTLYGTGEQLLRFYDVRQRIGDGEKTRDIRWILHGAICDRESGFYQDKRYEGQILFTYSDRSAAPGERYCLASRTTTDVSTIWPGYRLTLRRANEGYVAPPFGLAEAHETEYLIEPVGIPDAKPSIFTDGAISIVGPIPFFVADCALNDSTSSWACAVGRLKTGRLSYYDGSGNRSSRDLYGQDKEIARALSLRPRTTAPSAL
ncbi:MAG TPA: hypothetical protein VG735_02605 [Caulobacterales bacterium]|nr:hypothetical protein [Caulobacterales bacterium]